MALLLRVASQSSGASAVVAVCENGGSLNQAFLSELQSRAAQTLVACNRAYESRDGKYFDQPTGRQLWAVNLASVELSDRGAVAEGSVHCGFTCGGRLQIHLSESGGVWSVDQEFPVAIF